MKKTIYLLNIGDYAPDVTKLTYPYIEAYADKIGAEIYIIKTRKFPDWDMDFEKFQIYELAKKRKDDWILYIDGDALIHPDTPDITELLERDTVAHWGNDFALYRFKYDDYFRRDGRHISSCSWFAICSSWCLDLWKPMDDLTPQEAYDNISVVNVERIAELSNEHLVVDYALSRNIARYGLLFTTLKNLFEKYGLPPHHFFHHFFAISEEDKIAAIEAKIQQWQEEKVGT